jgi:hypothetical protein
MQSEASHIELTNPTPCDVCEPFEQVTLQCIANTANGMPTCIITATFMISICIILIIEDSRTTCKHWYLLPTSKFANKNKRQVTVQKAQYVCISLLGVFTGVSPLLPKHMQV